MNGYRQLWAGLVVFVLTQPTFSGDLALVSIENEQQAATVRQVCGSAYLRIDGRFLVDLEPGEAATLQSSGINADVIMTGVASDNIAFVLSDPAGTEPFYLSAYGRTVSLSDGGRLVSMSPASAASLQTMTGLKISRLSDWQTPIEYLPPRAYWNLSPDSYPTDSLVNLIRLDTLKAFDQKLEAYYTRWIWSDSIRKARDWMVQKLQSWGYTQVTTPTFSWGGGTHYNVQAIKTGYAEPNSFIVVGGHYDSYNTQSVNVVYAPGADDNGSGTALTLELARVFSTVPTRKSIIFMPFSAEEVGLVGSSAAATGFRSAGTNIECMYNFDMVAFVTDPVWGLNLSSGPNTAYRQIAADAATRLTSIVPYFTTMGNSSDHYSFAQQGFDVVDHIEHNFNSAGWHTNIDLSSRCNFNYFTEVAKLAIASVAIAANSGKPGKIDRIVDNGDGNSVTVYISGCQPTSNYWVRYGTSSANLIDSFPVPAGGCSTVVTGLTDGTPYYFGIFETPPDGYRSVWSTVGTQTPMLYPRAPLHLVTSPQPYAIDLVWGANLEGDLDHYTVYRKIEGIGEYSVVGSNITGLNFTDTHVQRQLPYQYVITAVDHDGHESPVSRIVLSYAATFDGGVLLVDEFVQEFYSQPSQAKQIVWHDTLFDQTPYARVVLDSSTDTLTRSHVARFSSIFWDDDDIYVKLLNASSDPVNWFLSHPTNMLIAGYRTIDKSTTSPVPPGHVLKTQCGLSSFVSPSQSDFVGAKGQNGWPSVQIDKTRGAYTLNYINKLTGIPGTTVIYTFDSEDDNPVNENQPIGLAWDAPQGKRVLLAFPLWNLTPLSAQALIAEALSYFGETSIRVSNGDVDGSGAVDIADLTMMVDYMYISMAPPPNLNGADVDHSCNIDIADLIYLVNYLYLGGPDPLPGCVT